MFNNISNLLIQVNTMNIDKEVNIKNACVICLEDIDKEKQDTTTFHGCHHTIHSECFFQYMKHNIHNATIISCPICRHVIIQLDQISPIENQTPVEIHENHIIGYNTYNHNNDTRFINSCYIFMCCSILLFGSGCIDWLMRNGY